MRIYPCVNLTKPKGMQMRYRALGSVALLIVAACSDKSRLSGPSLSNSRDIASSGPNVTKADTDMVATPVGLLHRACVHEVPVGATVDDANLVTRKDGTKFQIPVCPYPKTRSSASFLRSSAGPLRVSAPVINGYVESAQYNASGGTSFRQLYANWTVPQAPTQGGSNYTYYTFPGLVDASYILQPVLSWGNNNAYGGAYYSLASWKCNSGSDCHYSTPVTVYAGDAIHGSIVASSCTAGVSCTWTITGTDNTTSSSSTYSVSGTDGYTLALGAAVEVYGIGSCDQFPPPKVSYTSISLYNNSGTQVTPSWSKSVDSLSTPQCNFGVTYTSTTVDLAHLNPYLTVTDVATALITSAGTHSVGSASVLNYSTASSFYYTWMVQYCGTTSCTYGNSTDGSHSVFASGVGLSSQTMNFDASDTQRDVIVVIQEYSGGTGRSGWTHHLFTGPTF
jgi:hypothetical protein